MFIQELRNSQCKTEVSISWRAAPNEERDNTRENRERKMGTKHGIYYVITTLNQSNGAILISHLVSDRIQSITVSIFTYLSKSPDRCWYRVPPCSEEFNANYAKCAMSQEKTTITIV